MKKFGLILAGCLAFTGIWGAHAEDVGDVARAAARRASMASAPVSNRQKSSNITTRTNTTTTHSTQTVHDRAATTTTTRTNSTASDRVDGPSGTRGTNNVVPRSTTNTVQQRPTSNTSRTATRTAVSTTTDKAQNKSHTVSRAAVSGDVTRTDILARNYSKCKTVFFDCMDEFCANKDAQLKRCACSSRINEFDSVKKQLAAAEEEMLDFNQRLLTVSMDKEDAAALSIATEGEEAYLGTKDTSASKKTLDAIAKKLKTSFDSSNFNSDLNVLSWSLDMDSAFDSVNSLKGASTAVKSGPALYSAALPVCREMAAEVCSPSDVSLAESGYLALIEQDCNTVAKTYQSQVEQARAKVLEGSALLDMSRLDVYQKRNSDDILTCKKKMLTMLTDSTVCGDELGKCLDVTGQYIDPSTGEAFLSTDLVNLNKLLTRPTGDSTWSTAPGNAVFVSFLNSKRKFLEPAMENCQDIAENVWNSFIDDALSQIKLAQTKKLEAVRQGCTTLTAQCLSNASDSITDFDARALSIFGIRADITANAMCENVLTSCTALLESDDTNEWADGVSEIITTTSYETIMQTCRQVGRACIIQVCSSVSGNFGLCESIDNSTNRKSIINHTACWDEVKDCIRSAGEETINNIFTKSLNMGDTPDADLNFYASMYAYYADDEDDASNCITAEQNSDGTYESNCVFSDLCSKDCESDNSSSFDCRTCRLAENLWGNCEAKPTTRLIKESFHNMIKAPKYENSPTLLYWFAQNTNTQNAQDSCRDTTCPVGYDAKSKRDGTITCYPSSDVCFVSYNNVGTLSFADMVDSARTESITVADSGTPKCQWCQAKDSFERCCENKLVDDICVKDNDSQIVEIGSFTLSDGEQHILYCHGEMRTDSGNPKCDGTLIEIVDGKHYITPTNPDLVTETVMMPSSDGTAGQQCTAKPTRNNDGTYKWNWEPNTNDCSNPKNWSVKWSENGN